MKMILKSAVLTGFLVLSSFSFADEIVLNSDIQCSEGNAINGVNTGTVTGDNGGSDDCWGTNNGNLSSGDTINIDGMVYSELAKYDVDEAQYTGADIGLVIAGGDADCANGVSGLPATGGCWAFDPTKFSPDDSFLILIKAGNSPGYAVWLFGALGVDSFSGTWDITWKNNDPGGCCSGISHFSIYSKGQVTVPEPATLALLGLGLLGFAVMRRRA